MTVFCVCVLLSGGSKGSLYQRNEKLDKKISLYSGDITKLEIDAIVNAGMWVRGLDVGSFIVLHFLYLRQK